MLKHSDKVCFSNGVKLHVNKGKWFLLVTRKVKANIECNEKRSHHSAADPGIRQQTTNSDPQNGMCFTMGDYFFPPTQHTCSLFLFSFIF